MGTSRLNIWLRNINCEILTGVWRTDLVIQFCSGSYLVNVWPEILDQLKKRYSTQGKVYSSSEWPLTTDQTGKKLQLTIAGGGMQEHTFTSPAMSLIEIYNQIKDIFTDCKITLEDNQLKVTTDEYGPNATIVIGGDCDIVWNTIQDGDGYEILTHYYQGAQRIMFKPPSGEYVKYIEVDVPPGWYNIWTRVCHGANEETQAPTINAICGEEICVPLRLPQLKVCSAYVLHPLMDKIVYEQALADDDQRLIAFKGLMYGAQLGKQEIINQLNYRLQEAQEKDDTDLQNRVNAVLALANQLPECA